MEPSLVTQLAILEGQLNDTIDHLIKKRDTCDPKDKSAYRYICKKMEQALTKVHDAQTLISIKIVDFKLD